MSTTLQLEIEDPVTLFSHNTSRVNVTFRTALKCGTSKSLKKLGGSVYEKETTEVFIARDLGRNLNVLILRILVLMHSASNVLAVQGEEVFNL